MTEYSVDLYVYDLSQGMAKNLVPLLLGGKQIDGIWHTGVVVYGREYFFGTNGVQFVQPGGTILGHTYNILSMGQTQIPQDIFEDYLRALAEDKFRPEAYHLLNHNCNTFSDEICLFLVSKNIPSYITDLPNEVKSSPLGNLLLPIIDEIYRSGNQATPPESIISPRQSREDKPSNDNLNNSLSSSTLGSMLTEFLQQVPSLATQHSTLQQHLEPQHSEPQHLEQHPEQQEASIYGITKFCHEVNDVGSLVDQLKEISDLDKNLLDELGQYVLNGGDWSISRIHINLLCECIKSRNDSKSLLACRLLQAAMLKKDTPPVVFHDTQKTFGELLGNFSNDNESELLATLIKCVCNLLYHKGVVQESRVGKNSIYGAIIEFLVSCTLLQDVDINKMACQSISNIFLDWPSTEDCADVCFKLGISLMEMMQREELSGSTPVWFSILQCLKGSTELLAYASAMHSEGILNLDRREGDGDDVGMLKDDITKLTS